MKILAVFVVAAASFTAGYHYAIRKINLPSDFERIVQTDTLVMHDTVRITLPVPVQLDSGKSVRTVVVRDTIRLPAERRLYADSSFRAVVSGIDPRLDSLEIYPAIRTVRVRMPAARVSPWGIGVTAGISATPRGFSPSVSIGIIYTLWRP